MNKNTKNEVVESFKTAAGKVEVIVNKDGTEMRFLNGKLHGDKEPAVKFSNGSLGWYENGKLSRIGKPAFQSIDGDEIWAVEGVYHNANGPAIKIKGEQPKWYWKGVQITEKVFNTITQQKKAFGLENILK